MSSNFNVLKLRICCIWKIFTLLSDIYIFSDKNTLSLTLFFIWRRQQKKFLVMMMLYDNVDDDAANQCYKRCAYCKRSKWRRTKLIIISMIFVISSPRNWDELCRKMLVVSTNTCYVSANTFQVTQNYLNLSLYRHLSRYRKSTWFWFRVSEWERSKYIFVFFSSFFCSLFS